MAIQHPGDSAERESRPFNPNEHIMQIKSSQGSKDYLPVQWRLVWFRSICPEGTIDTEELEYDLDREVQAEVFVWNPEKRRSEKTIRKGRGYARYRAVVTDGKGGRATGTKAENDAQFPGSFGEKAETGAIGRALAALGYGTQFAPELDEEDRIVDSPVDRSSSSENTNHTNARRPMGDERSRTMQGGNSGQLADTTDAEATTQQLESIRKLSEHLGKAEPTNITTFAQAKDLIAQLSQEYRQSRTKNN